MVSEVGSDHPQDFRPPGVDGPQNPSIPAKLQLTREELRVLKECNRESFWYRCVPFSATLAGLSHMAVQRGLLKGHPTRGALGKNLAAIGIGYILGKWSYQSTCREKILALENSSLADAFRKQQQGKMFPGLSEVSLPDMGSYSGSTRSESNHGRDDYRNNEINTDVNVTYKGLDDSKRPNMDTDAEESNLRFKNTERQQSHTSYEELRKKNREEYVIRNTPAARSPPPNRQSMPRPPDPNPQQSQFPGRYSSEPSQSRPKGTSKNQYGDVWED